jgi:hypothetical protein
VGAAPAGSPGPAGDGDGDQQVEHDVGHDRAQRGEPQRAADAGIQRHEGAGRHERRNPDQPRGRCLAYPARVVGGRRPPPRPGQQQRDCHQGEDEAKRPDQLRGGQRVALAGRGVDQRGAKREHHAGHHEPDPAEPGGGAAPGEQRLGKHHRHPDAPDHVQGEHVQPPDPADAEQVAVLQQVQAEEVGVEQAHVPKPLLDHAVGGAQHQQRQAAAARPAGQLPDQQRTAAIHRHQGRVGIEEVGGDAAKQHLPHERGEQHQHQRGCGTTPQLSPPPIAPVVLGVVPHPAAQAAGVAGAGPSSSRAGSSGSVQATTIVGSIHSR